MGQRLPNRIFIFGITVLAVVIIVGGASWTLFHHNEEAPLVPDDSLPPSNNPTDQPEPRNPDTTPEPSENSSEIPNGSLISFEEQARDAAVAYIKSAHPATAQFLTGLEWAGGRLPTEEGEAETYIFYASDWTITVAWPLVADPTYNISAIYNSEYARIEWEGTYQNGVVKETKYSATR